MGKPLVIKGAKNVTSKKAGKVAPMNTSDYEVESNSERSQRPLVNKVNTGGRGSTALS